MKALISFLCVFMYFMSPYRFVGHEMPEIIGLISVILAIIAGFQLHFDRSYLLFFIYMWVIPPIAGLVSGISGDYTQAAIPVALILSSLYLAFLAPNVNKKDVIRCYRVLVYMAVGLFIVQEFFYSTVGFRPTLYLPFFEMYYEGADAASFSSSRAEMERSSSFFLEPSHFVQYILPYFCIVLSRYIKERKGLKELLVMTLVILWLRAGIGYVTMTVICIFFFLKSGALKMYQRILIVIVACFGFILLSTVYANNAIISSILERTAEFSMEVEASGSQSGFIRIWRGYFIYAAMDIRNQIFGVSPAGMESVSSSVFIPGCRYEGSYMNGIQTLLVSGGLIGLLLFINYILRLYKKIDLTGQCVLVAMITVFFMEHMLNTPKMFLYILVASCFIVPRQIK